jgi:peroxiredoxin
VELPDFVELQQRFSNDGLLFVGIASESGPTEDIHAFTDRLGVNYPITRGRPRLVQKYGGVSRIPTTYVIDRAGRVRFGHTGRAPPDTLADVVLDLLGEHAPRDAS